MMNKITKMVLAFAGFIILLFILIKAVDILTDNNLSGTSIVDVSNIKKALPIPGSCTASQNCGSPKCGISSGRGSSCGCGG